MANCDGDDGDAPLPDERPVLRDLPAGRGLVQGQGPGGDGDIAGARGLQGPGEYSAVHWSTS